MESSPPPPAVAARPLADFPPSVWGDFFLTRDLPSPPNLKHSEGWIKQRIEELVEQVKGLITKATSTTSLVGGAASDGGAVAGGMALPQLLKLVDNLERLGVSYHFEKEIDEALSLVHGCGDGGGGLDTVALRFRLLRQHGYHAPSNVFEKFTVNGAGNQFDEAAIGDDDIRGILSLYEAAHYRVPGEVLLDEAIAFARARLSSELLQAELQKSPALKQLVENAQKTPLLKKLRRLAARQYISIFQDDEGPRHDDDHHEMLLELAKLDFHALQSLHREELRQLTEWRKSLGIVEKFQFSRDRIAEGYMWTLSVFFEPQYSNSRIFANKFFTFVSILDDFYDSYGTYQELLQLNNAIQRWDVAAAYQLDDELMKMFFLLLHKTMEEFQDVDGKSHRIEYLKRDIKQASEAYLEEAKWRDEDWVPSLSEYLRVALVSSGYRALSCSCFVGMGEAAVAEDVFGWLATDSKLMVSINMINRIVNDIAANEFEHQRKHVASAVQCYMKEHPGASKGEAVAELTEMVEDGWQRVNREVLRRPVPAAVAAVLLNLARVSQMLYQDKVDYYTFSIMIKDNVELLLVKPIDF